MKSRFSIIILITVLVVLFWILWPRAVRLDRTPEQQSGAVTSTTGTKATTPTQPSGLPRPTASDVAKAHADSASNQVETMRKLLEEKNIPIDFYGQTVDQNGNPLPDVGIAIRVRHWGANVFGSPIQLDRRSDSSGMFDIHDATGDSFSVESMGKAGYELEPMRLTFGPSGGAPGNPVIFKLWRNDIKEPLITGQRSVEIAPDGRKYFIDITNGTVSETSEGSADISVWIKRPPNVAPGQRFDWSGGLQVLKGGALREETLDAAMYVAPTDGYSNLVQFGEAANLNGWGGGFGSRRFYLSLNSGHQVGRITISLYAYYNRKTPGLIRIEYAINPTGSRILR